MANCSNSGRKVAFLALAVLVCMQQACTAAVESSGSSDGSLPGTSDPAAERMLDWLSSNGAEVNIAVRAVPGLGRGVYAPKPFVKGDVLARIPVEMLWANHDRNKSEEHAALDLLTEMAKQDSPWKPYFDALPDASSILNSIRIPESYFPLIQHDWTEGSIKYVRAQIREVWEEYGQERLDAIQQGLSAANLTYAVSLLRTRVFGFPTADILIPLVDMGNHDNECNHSHMVESCDPADGHKQWQERNYPSLAAAAGSGVFGPASSSSSSTSSSSSGGLSGQCMVWRAETPIAVGQDVCNAYGAGLQDRMLLQYGFLQAGRATEMLNMIDRHTQDRKLWLVPFRGNLSATWAEIDRLASILNHLENGNAAAAAVQPDETTDPGGHYLSMLKDWRRQRIGAVHAEIRRLYREADLMKAGFERWMLGAVENGADAIAQVRRESAEQACTCVSGEGESSSAAVGTSAGVLQRVMKAVNPWYEEM